MGKTVAEIPEFGSGFLEISEKGFGFLRSDENSFQPKPTDIFVTPDTIKRRSLREGSFVYGTLQPPHRGTSPQLKEVITVNEMPYEEFIKATRFENLVTIDPVEKFILRPRLNSSKHESSTGHADRQGTRGLIVAPPRTGKMRLFSQAIANAITQNHPEVYVMVLLIDERPEEVTDFERS